MKVGPSRFWRRFHWLLLLLCLGGAVFATENKWLPSLRVGQMSIVDWLARLTSDEAATPEIALAPEPAKETNYSGSSWLNTALFSAPSSGWTLAWAKSGPAPVLAQQTTPLVQNSSASLPTAVFASGVVSYAPALTGPLPNAITASGTWNANASGNWSNSANWAGGIIADGAGNNALFNALDITTDVTVTLDSSRTIGSLFIGDTNGTNHYSIGSSGGSTLTFDDNTTDFQVHSILQQTSTSAGDTIAANMLIHNDLDINNLSATNEFTISGNIAANSGANFPIIWFNNHDTTSAAAGNIRVTGVISDGGAGPQVNIVVAQGGTVTFTGTNTYKGFTEVDGGTLLINGNNSAATGNVYVYNSGTLGGTGTIGGNVNVYGGTVTGATATSVGTLTMLGNANFASGEGDGGTYLANLSGAMSDLLAITGTLTLGTDTTLNIVGAGDGMTTYILATFASRNNTFEFVSGVPSGYSLVYNATDIELVPTAIPEPATWLGGALTLGAVALLRGRRRRKLVC